MPDAVVNFFSELLRVVVHPLYFAVDVGQFPPAVHPGELCRAGVPIAGVAIGKDIFQTESRFGIALQGFERHELDQTGGDPEYNSVWGIVAVNGPETRQILTQRLVQSINECTVFFQQLHMPLAQCRISDMALAGFLFCVFNSVAMKTCSIML